MQGGHLLKKVFFTELFRAVIPAAVGTTALACGNVLGTGNHFTAAFLLIAVALILSF